MSDEFKLKRFIIKGSRVQGVQLRESIAELANKEKIKGIAKNVGDDVEILFLSEDADKLKKIVGNAIKESGAKTGEPYSNEISDEYLFKKISKEEKFKVERDSELKEMVWGLKGAGYLFQKAARDVKDLLERKKGERIARLLAVYHELGHIYSLLEVGKPQQELVCIKSFISDPLYEYDSELIKDLIEFNYNYKFLKYEHKDYQQKVLLRSNKLRELVSNTLKEEDYDVERNEKV